MPDANSGCAPLVVEEGEQGYVPPSNMDDIVRTRREQPEGDEAARMNKAAMGQATMADLLADRSQLE